MVQPHWEGEPGTRVLGKNSELIRSALPLEEEAVTRRRKPLQAPAELWGLPQALSPRLSSSPGPSHHFTEIKMPVPSTAMR